MNICQFDEIWDIQRITALVSSKFLLFELIPVSHVCARPIELNQYLLDGIKQKLEIQINNPIHCHMGI